MVFVSSAYPESESECAAGAAEAPASPMAVRVLVVDDDEGFRRTLHVALNSSGFDVCDAADGNEALSAIPVFNPEVMVLDWQMPELDGIETLRALRVYSDLPVVMMSGKRSNMKETALREGASAYLAKPFSVDELLTRIRCVLKP